MASKYQPIVADEKFHDVFPGRSSTSESLGSTLLEDERDSRDTEPHRRFNSRWLWLGHAVLLSLSFVLFMSAYFTRASTLDYVQRYSAYSPVAKSIEYQRVKYNDTMGTNSPYVGASPEVDEAWNKIYYDMGDQMISDAERKIIDMPASHLKVKNPKTGVEGYRVGLEVFHQLHCVNLLRQVTYRDYYVNVSGDIADQENLQMHTDHCLEILRLHVQCSADVGVFTFYMLEGDPLPWPELDSWHTCRNFDKVRDWAAENSVGNMERPDLIPVEVPK